MAWSASWWVPGMAVPGRLFLHSLSSPSGTALLGVEDEGLRISLGVLLSLTAPQLSVRAVVSASAFSPSQMAAKGARSLDIKEDLTVRSLAASSKGSNQLLDPSAEQCQYLKPSPVTCGPDHAQCRLLLSASSLSHPFLRCCPGWSDCIASRCSSIIS
mmetsp:Transcript_31598/g.73999  ORF Transcript_31598/g.73999 Transcript_31598/m.73999 type:complete len:158 (-) Transcript_31598:198-671(-)